MGTEKAAFAQRLRFAFRALSAPISTIIACGERKNAAHFATASRITRERIRSCDGDGEDKKVKETSFVIMRLICECERKRESDRRVFFSNQKEIFD